MPHDLADLELAQPPNEPRPEQQAERERREAGGRRAERDVADDVEDVRTDRRADRGGGSSITPPSCSRSATRSVRVPREPLTSTRSPGATRRATGSAADGAVGEAVNASRDRVRPRPRRSTRPSAAGPPIDDQLVDARARRRAAARLVQRERRVAQLEHLAEHGDAAARRRRRRQRREHRAHRGRARVVGVVDEPRAVRQRVDRAAARHRRAASATRAAIVVERDAELERDRRRPPARSTAARGRRAAPSAAARRPASRRRPSCRRSRDRRRRVARTSAAADSPNVTRRPANLRDVRHDQRVVGIGDDDRAPASRARGSRPWRARSASRDPKWPMCASPTLVHTRTSGSAMPTSVRISPAWFMPSSTTATSGPVDELGERQRQPDVVVEVAAVAEHAVARREQLRRDFLRRRLAGAAGDRDDASRRDRRRIVAAEPLQRRRACRRTDDHRDAPAAVTGARHQHAGGARARARRATNACPSKRSPRSATNSAPGGDRPAVGRHARRTPRSARPRSGGRRSPRRPCPAVSATALTMRRHTRDAARRCPSAARATSTSSNGNVRSPMT